MTSNSISPSEQFPQEFSAVERLLKRQLKRTKLYKIKIDAELAEALRWEELHHEALLLQSNLFRLKRGMAQIEVEDWQPQEPTQRIIPLDTQLEPHVQVTKKFLKSKKLKKSIPFKTQFAQQTNEKIATLETQLQQLQAIDSLEELQQFKEMHQILSAEPLSSKSTLKEKKIPYREFSSATGARIWVGKSAKENDQLTFQYAQGRDWWLHASGVSGAHIIIKTVEKDGEPDAESIQDALQLALEYSKAKDAKEVEVVMAQCKDVKRYAKHAPGKVFVSKHRLLYVRLDMERLKTIKSRLKGVF